MVFYVKYDKKELFEDILGFKCRQFILISHYSLKHFTSKWVVIRSGSTEWSHSFLISLFLSFSLSFIIKIIKKHIQLSLVLKQTEEAVIFLILTNSGKFKAFVSARPKTFSTEHGPA